MGVGLSKMEKQQILSTLNFATHKMIKELEQNKMVGNLDLYHYCEDHFKGIAWLGFFRTFKYDHYDYSMLRVNIKCDYLDTHFKISFLMRQPDQKEGSKKWEAYNLQIEEQM